MKQSYLNSLNLAFLCTFFTMWYKNITGVTYIRPMFPFYSPMKHQEKYFSSEIGQLMNDPD